MSKTVTVHVRLAPKIRRILKAEAARQARSMQYIIEKALTAYAIIELVPVILNEKPDHE